MNVEPVHEGDRHSALNESQEAARHTDNAIADNRQDWHVGHGPMPLQAYEPTAGSGPDTDCFWLYNCLGQLPFGIQIETAGTMTLCDKVVLAKIWHI
jgi:hypothetical protein